MPARFINPILVFFLFISTVSAVKAENIFMEPFLGNESGAFYDAKILAYSAENQVAIFASSATEIPFYDGPENTTNNDLIYLKDLNTEQVTLLSKTESNSVTTEIVASSFSETTKNNEVFFIYAGSEPLNGDSYSGEWNSSGSKLFKFNLQTRTISAVSTQGQTLFGLEFLVSSEGHFYYHKNNQLNLSTNSGEDWQALSAECINPNLLDVSSDGRLLFSCYTGGPNPYSVYLFKPQTGNTDLLTHNYLKQNGQNGKFNAQEDSVFLAAGNTILKIGLDSLKTTYFMAEDFDLEEIFIQSAPISDHLIVTANRKVLLGKIDSEQVILHEKAGIYLLGLEDKLALKIDLIDHTQFDGTNAFEGLNNLYPKNLLFDTNDSSILLSSGYRKSAYEFHTFVSKVSLNTLFNNTQDNSIPVVANISPIAPHKNLVSVEHNSSNDHELLYKIQRHNEITDQTTTFWLYGTEFEDFQLGLQPGSNSYTVLRCTLNFNCNSESQYNSSVTTQEFNLDDNWNMEVVSNPVIDGYQSSFQVSASGFNVPDGTTLSMDLVGGTGIYGSNDTFSRSLSGNAPSAVLAVRPCVFNELNYPSLGYVCDEKGSIKEIALPPRTSLTLRISPNYDFIAVYFEQQDGFDYHIQRRHSGETEFTEIAQKVNNGWRDEDVQPGASYEYRVVSCAISSPELCNTGLHQQITLERSTSLHLSCGYQYSTGPIRLSVQNGLAVDNMLIMRATETQPYELISSLSATTETFQDVNAQIGQQYLYRVQSYFENILVDEAYCASALPGRQQINPFATKKVENLRVEESYILAELLVWDNLPDASQYEITITHEEDSYFESTVLIDQAVSPQFLFNYPEVRTGSYIFAVKPIFNNCSNVNVSCSIQKGVSTKISSSLAAPLIANKMISPTIFKVKQTDLNGISINSTAQSRLASQQFLERKKSSDENWQRIALINSATFYDSADALASDESYQYRIVSCSAYIQNCTTSAASAEVAFKGEGYKGVPEAPAIDYSNNSFNYTNNGTHTDYVSYVIVRGVWGDGAYQESWTIEDIEQPYKIPRHYRMKDGDLIKFQISYCFRTLIASYETHTCTEYSDEIVISLPSHVVTDRPKLNSVGMQLNLENQSALVQGEFSIFSSSFPETLQVYQAKNNEHFEFVEELVIPEDHDGNFELTYENLENDAYYQYAVRLCNSKGCYSRYSDSAWLNTKSILAPLAPTIVSVSSQQAASRIEVHYAPGSLTDYFLGYRATAEEGPFEQFDREYELHSMSDENLQPASTYFYRIDACNDFGCSSSEVLSGETATLYQQSTINISDNDFLAENVDDSIISINGSTTPFENVMDAFSGEINFNQWTTLLQNGELSVTSHLNASDDMCQTMLKYSLVIPNAINNKTDYKDSIAEIVYSDLNCTEVQGIEKNGIYLVSHYLEGPVKLPTELLASWHLYSLVFDGSGLFHFKIDGEDIATSHIPINLDIFGLVKFSLSSLNDATLPTYISEVNLTVDSESANTPDNVFELSTPQLSSIHPKYTHVNQSSGDRVEFSFLNAGEFSTVNNAVLHTGGALTAYIENIVIGGENTVFIRPCETEDCGPFRYYNFDARDYETYLRTPELSFYIDNETNILMISPKSFSYRNTDSFEIYKHSANDDQEAQLLKEITVEDIIELRLQSYDYPLAQDNLELGETAFYSIQQCNQIDCVSSTVIEFTMPEDSDGDGVIDIYDPFPNDPTESMDTDGDGVGNNADEDDDNDGIPDIIEIAAGLDSLSSSDGREDIDGDGFSNIIEYLVGSDLSEPSITPKDFGVYSSFEHNHEHYISIGENFERVEYSQDGNYSIRAYVPENEEVIAFTITGKLVNGRVLLSHTPAKDMLISITINGNPIDISDKTSNYPIEVYWDILAIDIEASEEPVALELSLKNQSNRFPIYPFIDNLFIPMTNAKLIGQRVTADYDGDGKTDVAVRKGSIGMNYALNSSDEAIQRVQFGSQEEDIQIEGDFDGDGIADFAVRRPSKGIWYVKNSSSSNLGSAREDGIQRVEFGSREDDIPVPADYDGDGITDFAVRRASNNMWYIKNSSGSNYNSAREDGIQRVKFGLQKTDIPLPADYDGDGIADIAFRRPSNSTWYILESSSGEIQRIKFGLQDTDIPVPADYDGDGKADVAFRRPSNKTWYVLRSSDDVIERIKFGLNKADIPVVGDYDGDGKADIAVRRESNSMWYILQSSDGEIGRVNFGKSDGMVPVLAPIWEKLSMLGWQEDFIDATLAGKASAKALVEDEEIFFEKSEFYSHEELVEMEKVNREPLH